MDQETLRQALDVFELSDAVTLDQLDERYSKLLFTWNPHRYANLTNNPRKYMQMYTKGEAKSRDIHAAYKVLKEWLEKTEGGKRKE
jgi:hypothetical protein